MKTSHLNFRLSLLALFCGLLGVIACNKSASEDPGLAKVAEVNAATAQAGKIHNSGLDYIAGTVFKLTTPGESFAKAIRTKGSSMSRAATLTTTTADIAAAAAAYVAKDPAYAGIKLANPDEAVRSLDELNAKFYDTGLQGQWTKSYSDNKLKSLATSREYAMVADIEATFNDLYKQNLTYDQFYTSFKSKVEDLKKKYAGIKYAENEGELFNGILSIGANSNEYWYEAFREADLILGGGDIILQPGNGEVISPCAFVQADCIGYLSGWASALWDDYNSPGGVKPSGQTRRIGQGVIWGLSASSFGLIRMKVAPKVVVTPILLPEPDKVVPVN
ncbi:hypothetical protein [Chitinophaga sp. sic0106]|uniref:hypothetical protein n=1 Tax=Chitinophaga sp. sic0106 TaxID=2854785 RepID=UPI001C451AD8|nr:hypothetical protein [Chitinophaga sp. sic0106]MBV7530628.1 hypothetical protein [Chitinophaga sp. sic0106]